MATINPQICASHERASISQHVYCRCLEVLRSSQTAEQSTTHPDLLDLRLLLKQLVGHGGADVLFELASVGLFGNLWGGTYSGRKGVDADSVLTPFLGDGTAHLVDCRFGGVVGSACEALLLSDS